MELDGVQQITMQNRNRIPDHPGEMMNPIADLIGDYNIILTSGQFRIRYVRLMP